RRTLHRADRAQAQAHASRPGGRRDRVPRLAGTDRGTALRESATLRGAALSRPWSPARLLLAPQGRFWNAQPPRGGADGNEKAARVARIAGRRFKAWYLRLPEAIEFQHQQLAQILAAHRRQRHAEMGRIRARFDRQTHVSLQAIDRVDAALHTLLMDDHST